MARNNNSADGSIKKEKNATEKASKFIFIKAIIFLAPSIWALIYYGFIVTPRYVSEASFVVRSSNRLAEGGISSFLKLIGVSSTPEDVFAVQDFISSREAILQLSSQLDLRSVYGDKNADFLSRYPNILYGKSLEEFHEYLKSRVSVYFNTNTGISTLKVEAFTAQDAQKISFILLQLGEKIVNQLNARIREDSVKQARLDVKLAEERLRAAQHAIMEFRNREVELDPTRSSSFFMELVAKLNDEQSRTRTLIAETIASSPKNPNLATLERRAQALKEQIKTEQSRISSSEEGLAQQIAKFEELTMEREFALRLFSSSMLSLENARAEARRQQLYLTKITGPDLPQKAMAPKIIEETFAIFAANIIVLLIIWLVKSGVDQHAPRISKRFS